MFHETSVTTSGGLRRDLPTVRLFEKAKRFVIWNPNDALIERHAG